MNRKADLPNVAWQRANSPFTQSEMMKRAIWGITCSLLFAPSPRPWHAWRRFLLRGFGAKISTTAHIYPRVVIWAPWNLEIGELVGVADGANLYSQAKIILEDYVTVSQESYLCTGSHDYRKTDFPLWTAPIRIKRNAWVAARAFIHPGVTVGENAVVGACAVVTHDIPDRAIAAGNPAVIIKFQDAHHKD
jgi:putative colanic acid biosynthesis acetyltransferase WcaF